MSKLERIVKFSPAYDKRPTYGIHGVELRMYLKGEAGAVQFVLSTNWQLPHVQQETDARILLYAGLTSVTTTDALADELEFRGFSKAATCWRQATRYMGQRQRGPLDEIDLQVSYHPSATDLGYHSPKPLRDYQVGEPPTFENCPVLGGPCWYDGSSLNAEPVFERLLREGDEGVWQELESYYEIVFGKGDDQ